MVVSSILIVMAAILIVMAARLIVMPSTPMVVVEVRKPVRVRGGSAYAGRAPAPRRARSAPLYKPWIRLVTWWLVSLVALGSCAVDGRVSGGAGGGGGPGLVESEGRSEGVPPAIGASAWKKQGMPAGLREAHRAAMQRNAPAEYAARAAGAGRLRASNPRQRLDVELDESGVHLGSSEGAPAQLSLAATAMGCEASLRPLAAASPSPAGERGNRVEYRRGAVTEWYLNGPLGVEQGFTLAASPACDGPKVVAVEAKGNLVAAQVTAAGKADEVAFRDTDGEVALRYTDLSARDANGKPLKAWLSVVGNEVRLHVDDAGAAYPVEIDPLVWNQQAQLAADDGPGPFGNTNDSLGSSVALSADGSTALLGAAGFDGRLGAIFVYGRAGGSWVLETKLSATGGAANDGLATAMALSGDGSTALVGAWAAGGSKGKAYVFARSGGTWTQAAQILADDGALNDRFGFAVALSADGATAAIGAPYRQIGTNQQQGAVYIYAQSSGAWTKQAELVAPDGAFGDNFGSSLALSGDGGRAISGAPYRANGASPYAGAAYFFTRAGVAWSLQQELMDSSGTSNEQFGGSVALADDGGTALIGASSATVGSNSSQGAAFVYVRAGEVWSQQAELTGSGGGASQHFGANVALSRDGQTAAVTATTGRLLYMYARSGNAWAEQAKLVPTSPDGYAGPVALSGDGSAALVGYPSFGGGKDGQGAAYGFTRSGASWIADPRISFEPSAAGDELGTSVALSNDGNTALVGARYDDVLGLDGAGSGYLFVRSGAVWTEQAQLVVSDSVFDGGAGTAVALSGDGATALLVLDHHGTGGGRAVAFFVRSGATWSPQGVLPADGASTSDLPGSAALSSDGDIALVGAEVHQVGANISQGAAYVFVRTGGTWALDSQLVAGDGAVQDYFGASVGLAADGRTALIGAPFHHPSTAYVFARSAGGWSQQAELRASDGAQGDDFAISVALSADGATALVGSPDHQVGANVNQGAAYVYARSAGAWPLQAELVADAGSKLEYFGTSVSLSADGSLAAIGGVSGNGSGSVRVLARSAGTWSQEAKITNTSGTPSDQFARTVALSADGSTLLVGAPWYFAGSNQFQGAAYIFLNPIALDGEVCTEAAGCKSGFCVDGVCCNTACDAGACDACSKAAGAATDGVCQILDVDDHDDCTVDACDPVQGITHTATPCVALDACHVAGVCNASTGVCTNPNQMDGTACDDGNPATGQDVCTAGVCAGKDLCAGVVCSAADECHDVGSCDPQTGTCNSPAKADGAPCAGGSCQAGICEKPDPGATSSTASGSGGASSSSTASGSGGGSSTASGSGGAGGATSSGAGTTGSTGSAGGGGGGAGGAVASTGAGTGGGAGGSPTTGTASSVTTGGATTGDQLVVGSGACSCSEAGSPRGSGLGGWPAGVLGLAALGARTWRRRRQARA